MKQYIGAKIVNAKPMSRKEYNDFRGWQLPADENGEDEGFLVEYVYGGKANTDAYQGYVTWLQKDVFEGAYKAVADNGISIEAIARICYEANRMYCISLGDHSQVPWNEATEREKENTIRAVDFICEKPDGPVSCIGQSWMSVKTAEGLVYYGESKDFESETNGCTNPYEELPPEQQFKNRLFACIVNAALGR